MTGGLTLPQNLSLLSFVIVFAAGLLSGLSPCTLPTIMLIIGYVGGQENLTRRKSFFISLAFTVGISLTLAGLGAAASLVGGLFNNNKLIWYISAGIIIVMGLYMLNVIDLNIDIPFFYKGKKGSGIMGAFLLGIPFSFIASPCTTPIVIVILTYVSSRGNFLLGALMLFLYGIGRSIPLLLVGTFTGLLKTFKSFEKYHKFITSTAGVILILLGLYLIWNTI